jgi:signal transduction histidine kinase
MDQLAGVEAFYRIFRDISTSVHTSSDIKEVLDLVVRKSTEVVNAKGAVLRILNLDTNELELSAACGLSERYLSKGHVSSGKIITELCRLNKVIIVDDVQTSPRVQYPREARDEGIKSMLDLPLTIRDHVVGIIRVFFMEHRRFTEEQLDFLTGIAEQCSLAIDKARLIENQRYRYHQLAIQTEKLSALGRMAAGVAHEVNNPLAGILLYSTNLVKKVPREGPLREGLQIIISETMRCKQIIQDLLEFSRDKPPEKVMASVNQMIEKDLSREIPDILLDGGQIQQVLVNLLINASESIGDHGTITIRSRTEPEWVRVEIEDTGCGIAPEHMAKIFEPFFSTKTKGTGLGLAVSFGIIQNHQGNIGATSQMGKGSCFTVDLPIIANP